MRLAQRKAELDATRESEEDPDDVQGSQEREVREGHERFKRLFEGIDSSDEEGGEDDGSEEGRSPGKEVEMDKKKKGEEKKEGDEGEGVVVV